MSEALAYLSLGSNMGDRAQNLRRALAQLAGKAGVCSVSSVYETAAWGYLEQPPFLNAACTVGTDLSPQELLCALQRIEALLGRQRPERWGPRSVDLDILFYDGLVLATPDLTIPHPRLHERAFVLVPLAEIAAELRHPTLGRTVAELLAEVAGREGVRLWGPPSHLWIGVLPGDRPPP